MHECQVPSPARASPKARDVELALEPWIPGGAGGLYVHQTTCSSPRLQTQRI